METFKTPYQYCDIFKEAGSPAALMRHYLFEPVWPRESLERHTEILRQFTDQRRSYKWFDQTPRDDLDRRTLSRLQTLVDHAFNTIPFYRDLYKQVGFAPGDLRTLADFEKLPILRKEDLRALFEDVSAQPWTEIRFMSRTSGSTGMPLSLINDTDRQRHWFVARMNMFEHMCGRPLSPSRWLYSIYYEPFLLTSILGGYKTFTVGLNADTEAVVEHIRSLRPQVITGVASHILRVAKLLPDAKELGIEAFTTNSETSSTGERRSLEQLTGVPVLDEYSSEELGIIAFEQQDGKYLVAEDTVHLELTEVEAGGLGSVVGTDLWNFVMPRIRYAQGDFAAWDQSEPQVGLRRLKALSGRQDMQIIIPSRGAIDPAQVLEIFDTTLVLANSGVREFRLVQKNLDDLRLLVKLEIGISQNNLAVERFKNRFAQLFGSQPELKIEFVSDLPALGRKRRCIVREFNV